MNANAVGQRSTVVPHKTVYYPNGDLVLYSRADENIITAFKVDKVMLARHSEVFDGMFRLPPPPEMETYDGQPSVRLTDKAEDIKVFLEALYDPR